MIVGIVQAREPLIRLTIHGSGGRQQEIEAIVDTGYTGWLTLPADVIAALSLRWQTFGRGILADGSGSAFDVWAGAVANQPLQDRGEVAVFKERRDFRAWDGLGDKARLMGFQKVPSRSSGN